MSGKKHSEYKTHQKYTELTKEAAPNAYLLWFKEEGRSLIEDEHNHSVYREITVKAGEIWSEYKSEDNDVFKKYTQKYENLKEEYEELISNLSKEKPKVKEI